jgi:hypothetical protein
MDNATTDGDTAATERPAGPVTIVRARYGGIYEPGFWLAFPLPPNQLPEDWDAGDSECYQFWQEHRDDYGGGDTPSDAYLDLLRRFRMSSGPSE